MRNLPRLLSKMEELKILISEEKVQKFHQIFDGHLSKEGYDPELKSVVGRVFQNHVVVGKIMQYANYPVFRAAILNNWNWMVLDPPQPILNEHNYWEVCYQMAFAARKFYCASTGKESRTRAYSPAFVISISGKLMFGQRASIEVRLNELTRQRMDFGTMLFLFYTSEKKLVAEAGLEFVAFPRDYEILIEESATSEEARKKLVNLVVRKNKRRKLLELFYLEPEPLSNLTVAIENGVIDKIAIEQVVNLW